MRSPTDPKGVGSGSSSQPEPALLCSEIALVHVSDGESISLVVVGGIRSAADLKGVWSSSGQSESDVGGDAIGDAVGLPVVSGLEADVAIPVCNRSPGAPAPGGPKGLSTSCDPKAEVAVGLDPGTVVPGVDPEIGVAVSGVLAVE